MGWDFFIRRPIFSAVLSIVIVLIGGLALLNLPLSQYPQIAPPTVTVVASYPGASPEALVNNVAAPLEEQERKRRADSKGGRRAWILHRRQAAKNK